MKIRKLRAGNDLSAVSRAYEAGGCAAHFTGTACESSGRWAFPVENGNMSGFWEGIFAAAESGIRLFR